MLALPPPAPAPVLPPPPPQPQRRSRRWPWIAGGVVIALILVASGSEVVASWHTYSATTGALPGATPPPTPPFQIINTPIHRPGYPGWFHIMASDGSFSLDGPGEATLVAAPHGAWELVVGGPYPTFVIYLYGYAFPDPSSTFGTRPAAYDSGAIR